MTAILIGLLVYAGLMVWAASYNTDKGDDD
jgi:hypothetical protein